MELSMLKFVFESKLYDCYGNNLGQMSTYCLGEPTAAIYLVYPS